MSAMANKKEAHARAELETAYIDYRSREVTTCSERYFLTALHSRLRAERLPITAYISVAFPIRTCAKRGPKFCLRAGDLVIVTHGLVIEIDGSAHDNLNRRVHRDNERETDWGRLGFHVFRIASDDIYNQERLSGLLDDVVRLLRQEAAKADHKAKYLCRRQRIERNRRAFLRKFPETDLGTSTWPLGHQRSRNSIDQIRHHPRRGGYIVFLGRGNAPSES